MSSLASEVAEEYEALVQFLYLAPVGLIQANLKGEIALANPLSAQLLLPLSPDGNLTNLFEVFQAVAPELRHLVKNFALQYGMVCDGLQIPLSTGGGGKSKPATLSLTLLKLDERRLMAVINDITNQVVRERLLQQNEAWLNAVIMGVTDYAMVRLDKTGCIYDWNTGIGRLTGFTSDDTVGQPFSVFNPKGSTTVDRIADRLGEADESGWSLAEGWCVKADGCRFWGSGMITPLLGGDIEEMNDDDQFFRQKTSIAPSPAYSLVIRDITHKREALELQRKAVSTDHLTGIGNRRTFFEAAELELSRGKRFPRKLSLLMLDIDHFKIINDTYGHPAGDAVLREFATLLTSTFREVDTVSRIGGEEFGVLMPSTEAEQAMSCAERLRQYVEAHVVQVDGTLIRYTISGGVATVSTDLADLEILMKRADAALYVAKGEGRNRMSCSTVDDLVHPNDLPTPS